jgi:hypothetical protein
MIWVLNFHRFLSRRTSLCYQTPQFDSFRRGVCNGWKWAGINGYLVKML